MFLSQITIVEHKRMMSGRKNLFSLNRSNTIKDHALTYSPKGQYTKVCSRAKCLTVLCHRGPGLIPESLMRSVLLSPNTKAVSQRMAGFS